MGKAVVGRWSVVKTYHSVVTAALSIQLLEIFRYYPAIVPLLLSFLVGSIFILAGRWIYGEPRRIVPRWLYHPNSRFLVIFSQVFATMLMFAGSAVIISWIVRRIAPNNLFGVVTLLGGITAAWLLRPRRQASLSVPLPVNTGSEKLLSSKRIRVIGMGFACVFAFALVLSAIIGHSDACDVAMRQATSSKDVVAYLGSPVQRGFWVSGEIQTSEASGRASLEIPLSGPKGKGTLFALESKTGGIWKIQSLEFAANGHATRINVLQGVSTTQGSDSARTPAEGKF